MGLIDTGYPSHATRVETWECDFNGHWNTRFYTRAFQCASETVAMLGGQGNPGAATVCSRHIRFHHELLRGDPVQVRSAVIDGGRWNGALVHWLDSGGVLSATALDMPVGAGPHPPQVPRLPQAALVHALPRGLVHEAPVARDIPGQGRRAHLGVLRPSAYDHTGALMMDELFRHVGYASHDHHCALGYTPQLVAEEGLSRMVVEMRVTLLGQAPAGAGIRSNSWLTHVQGKSFATAHHLETLEGSPIALVELCLVSVDLNLRRATRVPDFLRAHALEASSADGR